MARYTADEILERLDADAAATRFPMLDNGYIYPADVRLLAYRDAERWAILIEELGYHYKSTFPGGIYSTVYAVGSGAARQGVYMQGSQPLTCETDEEPEGYDVP